MPMTPDEARRLIIEGMTFAAYRETDSSLYDVDKNRLFGSEIYVSGRPIAKPSPWAEGDFEEKMAMLLRWANILNQNNAAFDEAQQLLRGEDSLIGRVIRRAKPCTTRHSLKQFLHRDAMLWSKSITLSSPSRPRYESLRACPAPEPLA
jgi:hypothetical protein